MLVAGFLFASLATSIIYGIKADGVRHVKDIWKPLLVFAGAFAALNILYVLAVFVVSLFFTKSKKIEKQSGICRNICFITSGLICTYAGVRTHITGEEKLPENDRFLYVCNHLSGFDPLVLFDKLRKYNIAFISKPSNMKTHIVGAIGSNAGCLSIDRENNREALKTINTAAEYLREDICSMAIYPEGTRSKDGELGAFHRGSFKIAKRAEAPVAIACCRGTNNVVKNIFHGGTDVYVDILEVIPAERVKEMSTAELADYSRNLILNHQRSCASN